MTSEMKNFFSYGSFLTLTTSTAVMTTVATAMSTAMHWSFPAWFPLLIALLTAMFGDYIAHKDEAKAQKGKYRDRVPLWFLNGCLIFTTSVGSASLASGGAEKGATAATQAAEAQVVAKQVESMATASEVKAVAGEVTLALDAFAECMKTEAAEKCKGTLTPDLERKLRAALDSPTLAEQDKALTLDISSHLLAVRAAAEIANPNIGLERLAAPLSPFR
jgi:hypothetical protein